PAAAAAIRQEFTARRLTMTAVSGTFNMIHPDPLKRQEGLRRLRVLAAACQPLGTSIITLCTGTRHPENMWRWHPDNDTPAAWHDLLLAMQAALEIAETYHVTLVIEPETSNVVNGASRGRRLLDEMRSPRLKVVMDAANLFHVAELDRMAEVLDQAFELLGQDVVLAHAKDIALDGNVVAAGKGRLDYDRYLALLDVAGYRGPLILHSLDESEVPGSLAFLRAKLAKKNVGFLVI
ncbi:MAG: sugar phosphate isomerase/epimerase, partial [Chloroflexi bacterium]|nr:sugar phosphate isomerase/epimerase [Chloroflexota bacterium]